MRDLKVTLVQSELIWHDIDANLTMFTDRLARSDDATDLIVLPEMFSTGFSMDAAPHAETMDGKAVAWLRAMASRKGADITGSLMIRDGERYHNRLIWCRPDGEIFTYDKKHLFAFAGEDKIYTAGERHLTLTLHGWRIRPFVCYDLRFPIWCRNLHGLYDVALFTANWPARRSAHWRTLLRARAIENQAFVIGVNRVGTDGNGLAYCGDSALIDPGGERLVEIRDEVLCQTCTLKRKILEDYRKQFPFLRDADAGLSTAPDL